MVYLVPDQLRLITDFSVIQSDLQPERPAEPKLVVTMNKEQLVPAYKRIS